jgi:purine-binding chemotaxis protein CheW
MEEVVTKTQKIISYLSFSLDKEHFALNVGRVVNILEMQPITKVPKSPEYIPGIINLRGEVLPVVDTNIKLGLGCTNVTGNTCILVIETDISEASVKFGILVDTVQEVLEIEDENILPSPSIGDKYETELISGVVEQDDKFIMILDINKLLDFNEVLYIQKIRTIN